MDKSAANRLTIFALAAILLIAFAAGGGGSAFALANLAVQLAAISLLSVSRISFIQFWRESPAALRVAVAASLALPLVQIIPLPEALWAQLPSRDLVSRTLEMTGENDRWMTMSLDPRRTLLALTALITPLAVLCAGWSLPRHRLIDLGWLVVVLGLVTVAIGVINLASPNAVPNPFDDSVSGAVLRGTFANRNSTGLFLGFALALAALLPLPRPQPALQAVRVGACVLLLLAIILTKSRTALVLAAIPLALGCLRVLWWWTQERAGLQRHHPRNGRHFVKVAIAALVFVAAGAAVLAATAPGRVSETLARFEAKDDPRRFIWDDATYSAARYWPAGAGQGTFDEVFQVDESLENLTRRRAGRAHNDYIELTIEAGIAGLLIAAGWLVMIAWLSWRARLSPLRWAAWSGSAFLLAIALQSITDYPLRNQMILAFAGFALLLLARIASDTSSAKPREAL